MVLLECNRDWKYKIGTSHTDLWAKIIPIFLMLHSVFFNQYIMMPYELLVFWCRCSNLNGYNKGQEKHLHEKTQNDSIFVYANKCWMQPRIHCGLGISWGSVMVKFIIFDHSTQCLFTLEYPGMKKCILFYEI